MNSSKIDYLILDTRLKRLKNIIESYYDIELVVPMLPEAKIGDNWLDTKDV